MSTWLRDLAVAYTFSGVDHYAEEGVELARYWFVDRATRMYPSGKNHGKAYFSIELHITIPTMIYAMDLLATAPAWDEIKAAVDRWIRAYLDDVEAGAGNSGYDGAIDNNIFAWWIVARATAATYLDDQAALDSAFEDWKTRAFKQLEPRGTLQYERQREDGLFYSLYGLKALALTAELARHRGVDLYGYTLNGTSALRLIFDHHIGYLLDPSTWRWGRGANGLTDKEREEGTSVYELAYSQWRDQGFRKVIRSSGRPLYERRVLGPVTLSHGNRFDLGL